MSSHHRATHTTSVIDFTKAFDTVWHEALWQVHTGTYDWYPAVGREMDNTAVGREMGNTAVSRANTGCTR